MTRRLIETDFSARTTKPNELDITHLRFLSGYGIP